MYVVCHYIHLRIHTDIITDFCDYCTPNVFDQWSLLREHLRSSFLATDKDHLVWFSEGPFSSLTAVRCQICNRSFEKVVIVLLQDSLMNVW